MMQSISGPLRNSPRSLSSSYQSSTNAALAAAMSTAITDSKALSSSLSRSSVSSMASNDPPESDIDEVGSLAESELSDVSASDNSYDDKIIVAEWCNDLRRSTPDAERLPQVPPTGRPKLTAQLVDEIYNRERAKWVRLSLKAAKFGLSLSHRYTTLKEYPHGYLDLQTNACA
ncbi:hypothetical protein EV182_004476, partial [Spiromyces aspiralis]